mmetsp:Transcript_1973/g.7360  ORF Transcript_1973/g.7360 Transcript_1973/m.7360 type:complete len:228 (-) Transcript_1973:345-1028(-)
MYAFMSSVGTACEVDAPPSDASTVFVNVARSRAARDAKKSSINSSCDTLSAPKSSKHASSVNPYASYSAPSPSPSPIAFALARVFNRSATLAARASHLRFASTNASDVEPSPPSASITARDSTYLIITSLARSLRAVSVQSLVPASSLDNADNASATRNASLMPRINPLTPRNCSTTSRRSLKARCVVRERSLARETVSFNTLHCASARDVASPSADAADAARAHLA